MPKTTAMLSAIAVLCGMAAPPLRSQAQPPPGSAPGQAAAPAHPHKSLHGGLVTDVGQDRHFELVVESGQFSVYVLDGGESVLPVSGMTASGDILIKGQARFPVNLTVSGDHFTGMLALNPAGRTTIIITVKAEGGSMIGRFVWAPAASHPTVAP